jgi:hypothetical protein
MNMNIFSRDNLRLEIAILQEDVDPKNPGTAKFKIPTLLTENTVASIQTNSTNIRNKTNGNLASAGINMENTIEIKIPLEYTYFYDAYVIPAGTRFIVAYIGANVNDIKIIGRYD